jgi:hypothetical protein
MPRPANIAFSRPSFVDKIHTKPAVPANALAKATRIPKKIINIIIDVTVIPI